MNKVQLVNQGFVKLVINCSSHWEKTDIDEDDSSHDQSLYTCTKSIKELYLGCFPQEAFFSAVTNSNQNKLTN